MMNKKRSLTHVNNQKTISLFMKMQMMEVIKMPKMLESVLNARLAVESSLKRLSCVIRRFARRFSFRNARSSMLKRLGKRQSRLNLKILITDQVNLQRKRRQRKSL